LIKTGNEKGLTVFARSPHLSLRIKQTNKALQIYKNGFFNKIFLPRAKSGDSFPSLDIMYLTRMYQNKISLLANFNLEAGGKRRSWLFIVSSFNEYS